MSSAAAVPSKRATTIGLGIVGSIVAITGFLGGGIAALVVALALLGTPLFAIMGGTSELAWMLDKNYGALRYIAPKVLDNHFAGSPILVTIPLFTFVGYVLAEAKTAQRLVRASSALVGWMPGGLAIVCVIASAIFTLFTGGSGVTIIAIGGLLYPALRHQGYSDKFSLGVVTTGGSVGLLLPYSLPLMVYSLVAGVDFNIAFKAVLLPGILVIVMLAAYSMYIGVTEKIPRRVASAREMFASVWDLKWELGIPVILVAGIKTGLAAIDEAAGLVALYTVLIEVFIYKDLELKKDIPNIAKSSMALGGAVILILSMANALINYVIQAKIPDIVLEFMLKLGLSSTWQFLIVMNVFLLILGMLMEGFSAILVAVPLILPFAARFHLGPFHLAMIFLLNLEMAYVCPPLGLNLFISSFRFNRPVVSLYKVVVPFTAVLLAALLLVSYVPSISNALVMGDIRAAREQADKEKRPPREAWLMECVQADRSNPLPCTPEDEKKYPNGQMPVAEIPTSTPTAEAGAPEQDAGSALPSTDEDDLLAQMMGGGAKKDGGASDAASSDAKAAEGGAATAPAPTSATTATDDELLQMMMGGGKKDGG
jgi:tripartite ATP-independent transporter DctM subunit